MKSNVLKLFFLVLVPLSFVGILFFSEYAASATNANVVRILHVCLVAIVQTWAIFIFRNGIRYFVYCLATLILSVSANIVLLRFNVISGGMCDVRAMTYMTKYSYFVLLFFILLALFQITLEKDGVIKWVKRPPVPAPGAEAIDRTQDAEGNDGKMKEKPR
ncbi:MAG: hypothetical protein V1809_16425 [Planctomycetota bacterium]